MRIDSATELNALLDVVDSCEHDVWLTSIYGDRFNLKSVISRQIGLGRLLDEHGDELELFCDSKEDEMRFLKLFNEHPEII